MRLNTSLVHSQRTFLWLLPVMSFLFVCRSIPPLSALKISFLSLWSEFLKYFYSTEIVIIVGKNGLGFPRVQLSLLLLFWLLHLFKYFHLSMSRPFKDGEDSLVSRGTILFIYFPFSFKLDVGFIFSLHVMSSEVFNFLMNVWRENENIQDKFKSYLNASFFI